MSQHQTSNKKEKSWIKCHKLLSKSKLSYTKSTIFGFSILGILYILVLLTLNGLNDTISGKATSGIESKFVCSKSNIDILDGYVNYEDFQATNSSEENHCSCEYCRITCTEINEDSLIMSINRLNDIDTCPFFELVLISGQLRDDRIPEFWLETLNIKIQKMHFENSRITNIQPDAFNSKVFRNTLKTLIIDNNFFNGNELFSFQFISKNSFNGLTALSELTIRNNPSIQVLDSLALKYIDETLIHISITNTGKTWSMNRIFSKVTLKNIKSVNMQNSNFPNLNATYFAGISKAVSSLTLVESNIKIIATGTFDEFSNLEELYLQNNQISIIPEHIFDHLLSLPNIRSIVIRGNKWNCDCQLLNLQELLKVHRDVFSYSNNSLCSFPNHLEGMSIIMVNLCDDTTNVEISSYFTSVSAPCNNPGNGNPPQCKTTVSQANDTTAIDLLTTQKIQTTSSEEMFSYDLSTEQIKGNFTTTNENWTPTTITSSDEYFILTCSQSELKTIELKMHYLKTNFSDFNIKKIRYDDKFVINIPSIKFQVHKGNHDDEVMVNFGQDYDSHETFLLYYPGTVNFYNIPWEIFDSMVHCQIVTSENITIKNLSLLTFYTFCVFIKDQHFRSPFQCQSFQPTTDKKPWLFEEQKVLILASVLLVLFSSFFVGVFITYGIIRTFPSLVKVKISTLNIKNQDNTELTSDSQIFKRSNGIKTVSQSLENATYLTPLPRKALETKLRRRDSDSSIASGKAYYCTNGMPPRFSQVVKELSEIPPPLPRRSISSVASTIELGRRNQNSIYNRNRIISDETENHYNFIV